MIQLFSAAVSPEDLIEEANSHFPQWTTPFFSLSHTKKIEDKCATPKLKKSRM